MVDVLWMMRSLDDARDDSLLSFRAESRNLMRSLHVGRDDR